MSAVIAPRVLSCFFVTTSVQQVTRPAAHASFGQALTFGRPVQLCSTTGKGAPGHGN